MLCRCHERPDQQDLPPPFRYDARHRRLLTASACSSCHSRSCYELVRSVLLVLCVIAVVIEIQVPVSCGEVAVVPGDIVVGDEEGVIVIPVRQPAPARQRSTRVRRWCAHSAGRYPLIFQLTGNIYVCLHGGRLRSQKRWPTWPSSTVRAVA
jgi:hypothetical protein